MFPQKISSSTGQRKITESYQTNLTLARPGSRRAMSVKKAMGYLDHTREHAKYQVTPHSNDVVMTSSKGGCSSLGTTGSLSNWLDEQLRKPRNSGLPATNYRQFFPIQF